MLKIRTKRYSLKDTRGELLAIVDVDKWAQW